MKTAKLKNGLICVSVAPDSGNFRFGKDDGHEGILKYDLFYDTKLNAWNLGNVILDQDYQILGTITKDECSFDLNQILLNFTNNAVGIFYENYKTKLNEFVTQIESFKSMIESETDFLFKNPNPNPVNYRGVMDDDYYKMVETWGKAKNRVIEKILILKPL